MDMTTAVKTVLGNYTNFSGRAARPEYWWWILATLILYFVLGLIDGAVLAPIMGYEAFSPDALRPLSLLASLAILLPNLAVAVRRLHDTDRSGWWLLLNLIPIIGSLILIFFLVQPGSQGDNRFG